MPIGKKKPLHTGVRTGCHYLISVCCVSCHFIVCGTLVVFTDCESCTRPISTTIPGIYRIGRVRANAWDLFHRMPSRVARGGRAAVDFVVCFGWGGFFRVFFFRPFFYFERTRPAASMRPPLASFTSLLVMRQGRGSEATDAVFLPLGTKASS